MGLPVFRPCLGRITATGLQKALHNWKNTKEPYKPCTRVFTRTTGLPCAHIINDRQAKGLVLQAVDFHLHWHWNRYRAIAPPILEPLQVISRNRTTTSTKRLPSGFEASEPQVRVCSQCKAPGHTRASRNCPVNLQRSIQEADPIRAGNLDTSQFVAREVIQSILDSASNSNSALYSALESILDSGDQWILKSALEIALNSTPQDSVQPVTGSAQLVTDPQDPVFIPPPTLSPRLPSIQLPSTQLPFRHSSPALSFKSTPEAEAEPDSRPIWPGRIKVIY